MFPQPTDFRDESQALHDLVAPLSDADFDRPTRFKGWTIGEILTHLHVWNKAADLSLTDDSAFVAYYAEFSRRRTAGETMRAIERSLVAPLKGLVLLADVTAHRHVLVFDAIDFGDAPGTLRVLRDREVPAWAGAKMSLHQQSFMELLAIAEVQGRTPAHLTLIGVQPEVLMDFGGSLSDSVRARVPEAIALAAAELAAWGFTAVLREAPPSARLNDESLCLADYERNRPAADAASRIGDARFLNIRHAIESGPSGRGTR